MHRLRSFAYAVFNLQWKCTAYKDQNWWIGYYWCSFHRVTFFVQLQSKANIKYGVDIQNVDVKTCLEGFEIIAKFTWISLLTFCIVPIARKHHWRKSPSTFERHGLSWRSLVLLVVLRQSLFTKANWSNSIMPLCIAKINGWPVHAA